MAEMKLTSLHVFRNAIGLGYPILESFLSSQGMSDECLLCVDPAFPDDMELVARIADVFPKVRVVTFRWPIGATGDGSVIGIASSFGLAQVGTQYVINVQSDEVYPVELMEHIRDNWRGWVARGANCTRLKILHTQFNASEFQGGEQWDGHKDTDVWSRGGMINSDHTRGGAGYNLSVKFAKKCPAISFRHDAWEFGGCMPFEFYHCEFSDQYPVVHLHDFFRDHYIAMRRNAGDNLWTDKQFGNYKADADRIEATRDQWWNDPKWTRTTSPFGDLLPDFAKRLLGRTHYQIDWSLLENWRWAS